MCGGEKTENDEEQKPWIPEFGRKCPCCLEANEPVHALWAGEARHIRALAAKGPIIRSSLVKQDIE
jgi:hypothetical protein